MIPFLRRLLSAWRLARHPHRPYLEAAAAALEWPVPEGIRRDGVVIDPGHGKVYYLMSYPCGCGSSQVIMLPEATREEIHAALTIAAMEMCRQAAERAGRHCIGDEDVKVVIDTGGMGRG